jgi:ABC-type nitrate/sulfonate/bicarbonate transport system substrate-binding protein
MYRNVRSCISVITASELQKLKIIYSSLTGAYTPLWIAVEKRLGRKHGLDLECIYVGRGMRPHQLLISGDAQYVASTGTGVLASYAVGLKGLVIIASFADRTGSSIFSKPEIKSLANLRGKVIGAGRPGGLSDTLLAYILKRRLGLDPTHDVNVVRLGDDPSILPALEHGAVDAGMLTTPARLMAKKRGFRELLDVDELGFQYPYVGISTLRANVKKYPETTGKLVRTLIDGIQIFKDQQRGQSACNEAILERRKQRNSGRHLWLFRHQNSKISLPLHRGNKNCP